MSALQLIHSSAKPVHSTLPPLPLYCTVELRVILPAILHPRWFICFIHSPRLVSFKYSVSLSLSLLHLLHDQLHWLRLSHHDGYSLVRARNGGVSVYAHTLCAISDHVAIDCPRMLSVQYNRCALYQVSPSVGQLSELRTRAHTHTHIHTHIDLRSCCFLDSSYASVPAQELLRIYMNM